MDSPDQGAMGLPLDSVVFAGDTLRCDLRPVLGVTEDHLALEAVILRRLYAAMRATDSAGVAREARALVEAPLSALPEPQRGSEADLDALARSASRTLWDPWVRWFAAHDPAPTLRRLRVPVLALNGSQDI